MSGKGKKRGRKSQKTTVDTLPEHKELLELKAPIKGKRTGKTLDDANVLVEKWTKLARVLTKSQKKDIIKAGGTASHCDSCNRGGFAYQAEFERPNAIDRVWLCEECVQNWSETLRQSIEYDFNEGVKKLKQIEIRLKFDEVMLASLRGLDPGTKKKRKKEHVLVRELEDRIERLNSSHQESMVDKAAIEKVLDEYDIVLNATK